MFRILKNSLILVAVLFFNLIFTLTPTTYADIPLSERNALLALYNSTNGDYWNNNSGWKTPPLHTDGFAMPGTESNWYVVSLFNTV